MQVKAQNALEYLHYKNIILLFSIIQYLQTEEHTQECNAQTTRVNFNPPQQVVNARIYELETSHCSSFTETYSPSASQSCFVCVLINEVSLNCEL